MLNVFLVPDAVLRDVGLPASFPVAQPTLSGIVFEATSNGKKPVAGAQIVADYSGGLGWGPAATTVSDRTGRYILCGLQPARLGIAIFASHGNRSAEVSLPFGVSALDIDIAARE